MYKTCKHSVSRYQTVGEVVSQCHWLTTLTAHFSPKMCHRSDQLSHVTNLVICTHGNKIKLFLFLANFPYLILNSWQVAHPATHTIKSIHFSHEMTLSNTTKWRITRHFSYNKTQDTRVTSIMSTRNWEHIVGINVRYNQCIRYLNNEYCHTLSLYCLFNFNPNVWKLRHSNSLHSGTCDDRMK